MKPTALITWASWWLWADFALQLAQRWYHCILIARSTDKLTQVQSQIQISGWTADIYSLDLTNPTYMDTIHKILSHTQVNVIINNAWFGTYGQFVDIALDKQLSMIDLNIRTLTALTHVWAQHMLTHWWYILNVASTAAFQPGPKMATYFASKSYVLSLSQALNFEMRNTWVHISTLCPGPTQTNFFDNSDVDSDSSMTNSMMQPWVVVQAWLDWLFAHQRVIIPWLMNKIGYYLSPLLPTSRAMTLISKII